MAGINFVPVVIIKRTTANSIDHEIEVCDDYTSAVGRALCLNLEPCIEASAVFMPVIGGE